MRVEEDGVAMSPGPDGSAGSSGAVEILTSLASDLSDRDRSAIHDLFDVVYREADHDYLADQLVTLGTVAIAKIDGEIVGFFVSGQREIDLPVLGPTTVSLHGLACTHPSARRRRIMQALSATMWMSSPGNRLGASRLATPATLKGAAASAQLMAWPSGDDPFVLYRASTATQRAIAHAVADAHGAHDFDERHFVCIGRGRPIGEPVIDVDADDEFWRLFDAVDRSRGDTLLWLDWTLPPPASWHG